MPSPARPCPPAPGRCRAACAANEFRRPSAAAPMPCACRTSCHRRWVHAAVPRPVRRGRRGAMRTLRPAVRTERLLCEPIGCNANGRTGKIMCGCNSVIFDSVIRSSGSNRRYFRHRASLPVRAFGDLLHVRHVVAARAATTRIAVWLDLPLIRNRTSSCPWWHHRHRALTPGVLHACRPISDATMPSDPIPDDWTGRTRAFHSGHYQAESPAR
jgi:hypothetical protein